MTDAKRLGGATLIAGVMATTHVVGAAATPAVTAELVPSADVASLGELAAAPERIGLRAAIARAVADNPAMASARAEAARARGLAAQADAAVWPAVHAEAGLAQLDAERAIGGRVVQSATAGNARVVAQVPAFAPKLWSRASQAKDSRIVALLAVDDAARTIGLQVARAWLAVVTQHRALAVQVRALATAREHERFAQGRAVGGAAGRLDVLRASQEADTVLAQVHALRAGLARSRLQLGQVIGAAGAVDVTSGWDALDLPAAATNTRADVIAALARVDAARRTVGDLWAEYAPVLTVVGQAFFQQPATATSPALGWSAQLQASVPLWDGGAREALALQHEAALATARAALVGVLRQAAFEVAGAAEAVREADAGLAAARRSAAAAAAALTLVEHAWRAGATTSLELVDAERRARDAEAAVVAAEDAVRSLQVEVLFAAGRLP
ncbi:MAG: TolC family protein [Myxococcales bacterium]|nr:TolC family protein [Myxococcales bacterium]